MITPTPRLLAAIQTVWQQIAPDIVWFPDEPDNEAALEMCLDADRLDPRSGHQDDAEAHAEYRRMIADYGWREVVVALAKHPQLQFA
jgi:hypothetical protein